MFLKLFALVVATTLSCAAAFPFSFWKNSGGPSVPGWGGESQAISAGSGARTATTFTLTAGIGSGSPPVLLASCSNRNATDPITAITDSKGNTWTVQQQSYNANATYRIVVATGAITTPLVIGDTITITFTNNTLTSADWVYIQTTVNCTSVGVSAVSNASSTSFSCPGTTIHAPSVQIGIVVTQQAVSSFTWTFIGSPPRSNKSYPFYTTTASIGLIGPTATITPSAGYAAAWVSLY